MPVEVITMTSQLASLREALLDQQMKQAEKVGKQAEADLKRSLNQTLQHSNESDKKPLANAQIRFKTHVIRTQNGAEIKINVLVTDGGSKPHFIWHILSFGRRGFIQPTTSPPIPERRGLRTSPGSLLARSFPGFTGNFFVIPAGTFVGPIPARGWYEKAGDELEKNFMRKKTYGGFKLREIHAVKP